MKSVDIITPFYKGNEYLESLSNLIRENAHHVADSCKVNWIIVNDSPSCNVQIRNISPEISYNIINHTQNRGIHQARVTGIVNSRADYILLLDQDDVIEKNYLQSQLQKIGNSDVVVCNGYAEDDSGNLKKIYNKKADLLQTKSLNSFLNITNVIKSPGQCLIKRTSVPNEYCNYIMKNNGSDDLLLWILMLTKKEIFATNEEYLYTHKYTGVNVSQENTIIGKSSFEVEEILKKCKILNDKQIKDLDRSIKWSLMNNFEKKRSLLSNLHLVNIREYWKIKKLFSRNI